MNIFKKLKYKHIQNKKFYAYAVIKKSDPNLFLCVTLFQEQGIEYAMKLLRVNKDQHFRQWCAVRDYKIDDSKAWDEYYTNCISDEEKDTYGIVRIYYPYSNVAALIRMLCGSNLLGCSFETDAERTYEVKMKPIRELQEAINKELNKMKKESEEDSSIPEGNKS